MPGPHVVEYETEWRVDEHRLDVAGEDVERIDYEYVGTLEAARAAVRGKRLPTISRCTQEVRYNESYPNGIVEAETSVVVWKSIAFNRAMKAARIENRKRDRAWSARQ
jgi:hypothetical protein